MANEIDGLGAPPLPYGAGTGVQQRSGGVDAPAATEETAGTEAERKKVASLAVATAMQQDGMLAPKVKGPVNLNPGPAGDGVSTEKLIQTAGRGGIGSVRAHEIANPDLKYDGKLIGTGGADFPPNKPIADVPGFTPKDGLKNDRVIIATNGINTPKDAQAKTLQAFADRTGSKVVGVHNSTEGTFSDVVQSVEDKANVGKNAAVNTLGDTVYKELTAGNKVNLMGHSQGALITSRALDNVKQKLTSDYGKLDEFKGLAPDEKQRQVNAKVDTKMSDVYCVTFGGAAAHYPDGPHYTHYVNSADPVAHYFGLGTGNLPPDSGSKVAKELGGGLDGAAIGAYRDYHPGVAGDPNHSPAMVIRFEDNQGSMVDNHSIDNLYLPHFPKNVSVPWSRD